VSRTADGFTVDGRPTDYWNAPRPYGPWADGYFKGFGGGVLESLIIGSALGVGLGLGAEAIGNCSTETETAAAAFVARSRMSRRAYVSV
jgi:hypothetical protein